MDARLLNVLQLVRDGQRETALLRLRAYIQAYPEDPDAWVVLSKLVPNRELALSALRRAGRLAPNDAAVREALAALEPTAVTPSSVLPESPSACTDVPPHTDAAVGAAPSHPLTELSAAAESTDGAPRQENGDLATLVKSEEVGESEAGLAAGSADLDASAPNAVPAETSFQAVRDARAVEWPFTARGQKPRTLGALLDENQLTRQDLLWAMKEARNEEVRRAAQVILATAHRLADVTMALEDARLMAWPFRRLNRPLGKLVETGLVRVKDLRRAAWYAKSARLREAARLMLPIALERREREQRKRAAQSEQQVERKTQSAELQAVVPTSPPEVGVSKPESERPKVRVSEDSTAKRRPGVVADDHSSRPMAIIQGSDYLANEVQRRYRQSALVAAFMIFLLLAGLLVVLVIIVMEFVRHQAPPLWLWPMGALLLLPLFWLSDRFMELWQEQQSFRRGQLGESQVARRLRHGFGGDWTLFRNVKLPGSQVDIDMVLLGPPGMFALEVKAYMGAYLYAKQHFYRRVMMTWRRMRHNPGKQARAAAKLLHDYITDTLNEDIWVEPRLVWVGPGELVLKDPEVFVWFYDQLDQETERLRALPRQLSAERRAALSGLLRGLCSTLRQGD